MGRYVYFWNKLPVWNTPGDYQPKTKVSVIIPARNEAKQIKTCLQSILNQDFPTHLMEVILVDDHSTDDTYTIAMGISDDHLRIIKLSDFLVDSESRAYKKKALETGIQQSSGALILTTDADCMVPSNWLRRMCHLYETEQAKFIAAPVNFYQEQNLLERFQSLDFTGMMGITGAGIAGRFMHMCNGANLGFDRGAFEAVGGYAGIDHLASGDDMLLMQKIARQYPGELFFLKHPAATVLTKAQPTINSFLNQRIRWASKSSEYKEWQVTAMLGIVWLYCWAIIIASISIFMLGSDMLGSTLLLLAGKNIADFILLRNTSHFFKRKDLMRYFLPAQIMHIFYIVIVGTLGLFVKDYTWKGRVVR